jgi:hypothetical protein
MVERDEDDELNITPRILEVMENHSGKGIETLVDAISQAEGVDPHEAARIIYYLERRGEIALRDVNPPRGFMEYLSSFYSWWFWVMTGGVLITLLAIYLLPQSPPWIYLRYVFGAIYVLYIPGSALIEALYPQRDDLEQLERFALSIGLSLALVPLVGLVLNYTPWGIRLNPIFASLTLLTLSLGVLGVYRKYQYFQLGLEARRVQRVEAP